MKSRKDIKAEAVAQAETAKAKRQEREEELAPLPAKERRAARNADKTAAKRQAASEKAARKATRKSMSRAEKRQDKREARNFRKVKNRPRRLVGWGIAASIILLIGIMATPFVSDAARLFQVDVDSSTAEGEDARVYAQAVSAQISDEGLILLQNEGDLLPLSNPKVNVFSFASFNLRYGGGGSGGADLSRAVPFYEALERSGIDYNKDLYQTMVEAGASESTSNSTGLVQVLGAMLGDSEEDEIAPDYLTEDVLENAKAHSHTAVLVFGNDGVESQDFTAEQLRITNNQEALLDKVSANFDDIVLIVNSGNQMELGFLNDYPQIKSVIWIGTPGPSGGVALAKTLIGENNPSGRLTDTYVYDVESAPSTVNFSNFKYDNADRGFFNYEEGIYVGYRYYETRYEGDEAAYDQVVQFPFGFGLSYTDFDWDISDPVITDETVSVDVKVTNTGDLAGKDVVEVYYSAPYFAGGPEKASTVLAGYNKTSLLEPGASEILNVTFNVDDMASWDTQGGGGYVLDAGDYKLYVSTDVHSPVQTFDFQIDETKRITADSTTGAELENRFEYADGDLTYLSRSDWEGTYPNAETRNYTASQEVLEGMPTLSERLADGSVEKTEGTVPTYGAANGLRLEDMKGLEFDDPQWDLFLDQFTAGEMAQMLSAGAYSTVEMPRLGIPSTTLLDGPAGLNSFFTKINAASFPTAVVVASTWNNALAYALGEAVGLEANAYGVQGWYAPGINIHRTAMGGRNFEYFSEDPLLAGKMSAAMVAGAEDQDVITFVKHFALNEQETNARSGVNVFLDEQALREIYIKPFEITVKEGNASGAMSSFVHIGTKWSGGNPELLQDVLRDEWGFDGIVSTDAVIGSFMDPAEAAMNGNELMLAPLSSATLRTTIKALNADPVGMGNALRDRTHQTAYTILQTDLFE